MGQATSAILGQIEAWMRNGETEQSLAYLQNAITEQPDELLLKVKLADILHQTGQEEAAFDRYLEGAYAYAERGELAFATALYRLMMALNTERQRQEHDDHSIRHELVQRYQVARASRAGARDATPDIQLFQDMPREALEAFVLHLEPVRLATGTEVFRQGDPSGGLYIVTQGFVGISRLNADGEDVQLARLGPGDFFGEWGLLTGEKHRHATVTAVTDVALLELSRETLTTIIGRYPSVRDIMAAFYRRRRLDSLLAQIFPVLEPAERRRLAEVMEQDVQYAAGTYIFQEGDRSAFMSIIASGTVEVLARGLDDENVSVARLGPGNFVGEGGALTGSPRTASVRAVTDVVVHNIAREDLVTALVQRPEVLMSLQGVREERLGATLERLSELDDFDFGMSWDTPSA